MSDRGEYRSIRSVLIDGPDFQGLAAHARSLFLYLKINFGPAGIEVWYHDELVARLARQSGLQAATVEDGLCVLEASHWIRTEANVVWIIGQLEHDPHIHAADPKHRKMVQRHVAGLPNLAIKRAFIEAHPAWFVDVTEPVQEQRRASEVPSNGLASTKNKNKDNDKKRGSSRGNGGLPTSPLPREAIEFGARFYGTAPPKRRREVYEQLLATLTTGAPFGKGVVVRAGSAERLAVKCLAVMREGVRKPDAAIVVLLRKLADVSDDSPTERAAAEARTQVHTPAIADAWIRAHPIEFAELERRGDARYPGEDPFRAEIRRAWVLSQVIARTRPSPQLTGAP